MMKGARDGNVEEGYCQTAASLQKVSGVQKKNNGKSIQDAMKASLGRQKPTYPNDTDD